MDDAFSYGYVNETVRKMYGIPYNQLTDIQKKILHLDSQRRAKLIKERQDAVLKNNLKAFEDEAKMENVLALIYKDCQKKILADVTETIAKVKKDGGEWSYANQSALTRSRGLFTQISGELSKLGQQEQEIFTQGLSDIYTDQFLRQVYLMGQSIPVKANFNRLNPALVKKTLDYPWSGAMFSDRLWQDKGNLGRNLRIGLTQSMILGEGIPEITERINKGINTSRYNAERVARTETKRVTYCAHNDAYEDMGVEELEYRCANGGDSRTCDLCRADNGKHYKRGTEPTLPRHPNCRCVYIPVVSDEFGDNELNELTGSIRGAENYEKWKEAQDEKIKQAKLLKDVEDKKNELEDAQFNLAYLQGSSGTYGTGYYSGIWMDDVTLQDYALKKDKIPAKKQYFEDQLLKDGADKDKFTALLTSLEDFEEKGKQYEAQAATVKRLKKELEDLQKKAGIWVDDPYTQERKDAAYWFKNTSDADTVLRGVCGEVWKKSPKDQKYAAWDYTQGSGKFNRPLTGHAGSWYNFIGNKKVSIDYEGGGEEIRRMTNLIDKSEYDFDIWLQRGCGSEAIDSMLGIKDFSSMTEEEMQKFVGKGGRQYNFISTGVAKGKGFSGDVICNIYAPKGTKMIYAEPFSYYSGAEYDTSEGDKLWDGSKKQSHFGSESEMIIQRGAYYRITKIEKSGYTTFMDMEVVLDKGYDKHQQRGAFKGYGS